VPTFKDQQEQIENKDLNTYGFLGYPLLQTADIIIYRANFVPVGEDQASHLEFSREVVRRFNNFYGDVFPEPQPLFTETPKVPGLDARKMSKSYKTPSGSASADEIRELVMTMFTDPNRIRRKDPGNPDICNLFQFHKLFSNEETITRVDRECRAAEIGCVDDKKLLAEIMIESLRPIRERREEIDRDPSIVWDALRDGNRKARERAQQTMQLVRDAVKINYRGCDDDHGDERARGLANRRTTVPPMSRTKLRRAQSHTFIPRTADLLLHLIKHHKIDIYDIPSR
jgi:tryptophanyl-tRNA synthetase